MDVLPGSGVVVVVVVVFGFGLPYPPLPRPDGLATIPDTRMAKVTTTKNFIL